MWSTKEWGTRRRRVWGCSKGRGVMDAGTNVDGWEERLGAQVRKVWYLKLFL